MRIFITGFHETVFVSRFFYVTGNC